MNDNTNSGATSQSKHISLKIDWKIFVLIILALGAFGSWYTWHVLVSTPAQTIENIINKTIEAFKSESRELVITQENGTSRYVCQFVTLETEAPVVIKYTEDNWWLPNRTIEIKNTYKVKYGVDITDLSIKNNFVTTNGEWELRNLEGCVISVAPAGQAALLIDDSIFNEVEPTFVNQLRNQLDSKAEENAHNNHFNKNLALTKFIELFHNKMLQIQQDKTLPQG